MPVDGGGTVRDHLKIRRPNDELLLPVIMDDYDNYIIAVINQLTRDRMPVFEGIGPIPLQAFINYSILFKDELHEEEILLIQTIDDAYRRAIIESKSNDRK